MKILESIIAFFAKSKKKTQAKPAGWKNSYPEHFTKTEYPKKDGLWFEPFYMPEKLKNKINKENEELLCIQRLIEAKK